MIVEPAVGVSVLPLGCAELLTQADFGKFVDVHIVVDEKHLVQNIEEAARAQAGQLLCGWADSEFRGTGWSNQAELRVIPSAESTISIGPDETGQVLTLVEAAVPTAASACAPDDYGYAFCRMVQLRDGYRLDLALSTQLTSDESVRSVTEGLLSRVGDAIDRAGERRVVANPDGTVNPESLCSAAQLWSVVEARGASGAPTVTSSEIADGVVVTTCTWRVPDPYEGGLDYPITVDVLPGGAWALPLIAQGVGVYPLWYTSSADGSYQVGSGDWLAAFRVLGSDLIRIGVPPGPPGLADQESWETLLASSW